jgi:hypothetical protein
VRRRSFLPFLTGAVTFALSEQQSVRGTLSNKDGKPTLRTPQGVVPLTGDPETTLVLQDKRLDGADFEAAGQRNAAGQFEIGPIHTRSMFLHRDGKRLAVSYWCDICYIRTWSPGTCWCCQEQTRLDPVDPATLDDANAKSRNSSGGR